jgi:hypothetical protein
MGNQDSRPHVLLQSPWTCKDVRLQHIPTETITIAHSWCHEQVNLRQRGQLACLLTGHTPCMEWPTWTHPWSILPCIPHPGKNWMGSILLRANCKRLAMTNYYVLQDLATWRVIHLGSINANCHYRTVDTINHHMETTKNGASWQWQCTIPQATM